MSKSLYTLGKALSNFAVLAAMVAVLAAAAAILQLARPEGAGFEPGKLLAPFVWVALPAMAMTAAVAVLFETLPVLRGGAGNVIYFFAWATYLGVSGVTGANDYLGLGFFMRNMTDCAETGRSVATETDNSRSRPDPSCPRHQNISLERRGLDSAGAAGPTAMGRDCHRNRLAVRAVLPPLRSGARDLAGARRRLRTGMENRPAHHGLPFARAAAEIHLTPLARSARGSRVPAPGSSPSCV